MRKNADAVIIGAGVAGSTTAIILRRLGLDVVLVEREPVFRDRIRGELIHPWGAAVLRDLGLYDEVVARTGAFEHRYWQTYRDRVANDPYPWASDFPDAPNSLGVRHVDLQNTLIEMAREAGATIHRPASVQLSKQGDGIQVTIGDASGEIIVHTRLLIGADGQRSATRTWFGGSLSSDPPHHIIGGTVITNLDLSTDRVHQAYFEGGFTLISPQPDQTARVYLVCTNDQAEAIRSAPDASRAYVDLLRNSLPEGVVEPASTTIGPLGFFSNANQIASIPESKHLVLVGEAAGSTDPSQGHGLSLTFNSVAILRDLFIAETPLDSLARHHRQRVQTDIEVIRQLSRWVEPLATETGPEIDAMKDRIKAARELDPSGGGFAGILATGPHGLVADELARSRYFGEFLPGIHA